MFSALEIKDMARTYNKYNELLYITKDVYFSKNTAAMIVGGRRRLEELVGRGKIQADKPTSHQHGKWRCKASDVLRNAYSKEYKNIL